MADHPEEGPLDGSTSKPAPTSIVDKAPDDVERVAQIVARASGGSLNPGLGVPGDYPVSRYDFAAAEAILATLSSPAPAGGGEDFLTQLRRVNAERYKAWTGDGVEDPLYLSNEFGGEAGEVQNVVKKLVREQRGWKGSRATVEQLADEIADGIICLDNLARGYGIDLAAAVFRKFNETSDKNGFPHKLTLSNTVAPAPVSGEVERLREALDKFGQHKNGCNVARALPFERRSGTVKCTCGFDAARQSLETTAASSSGERA